MVKDVKYIYWVKKDLFGCFKIEGDRDKDNETGLKEGGGIKIETNSAGRSNRNVNYSAFHIRDARSLSLELLTCNLYRYFHFYQRRSTSSKLLNHS